MRILLLLLLIVPLSVLGQYHLSEIGFKASAGAAVPVMVETELDGYTANASIGFGHRVSGYFSHWICGKSYGYQFELGYRGQNHTHSIEPNGGSPGANEEWTDYFGFIDIGAFLKWRPKNFHRDKEWNLVIGPKLNILVLDSQIEGVDLGQPNLGSDYNRIQPALHASVWFRFPWTKRRHWFLSPGIDFMPLNIGQTRSGATFSTLYPHMSFAMTLYNTK